MRKGLAALCGLSLLGGLLAVPRPCASAGAGSIDKELLGVRLLQSYKTVLALYGQPTRIYRGDESVNLIPATGPDGQETGGVKGLGDASSAGGPGGGGGGGGPMGAPGSGGGPAPMGAPGGRGKGEGGGPMGVPGGGPSAMGAPGSGGGPLGSAGANDKPVTFAESGGFTWAYFYPKQEIAYIFFFNRDGRVEMIAEHGRWLGKPSSRGVHLGDPVKGVYATYGWPDTVEPQATTVALNYNIKHHALFNVLKGKVTAISVILQESNYPHLIGANDQAKAGGPGGGAPMSPGAPGGGRPNRPGTSGGGGRGGANMGGLE